MGTSTVHRSPLHAAHWRVVNNLYRNPTVDRERLVAEIFRAAAKPYVTGLAGREVTERLRLLLSTWSSKAKARTSTEALNLARELIGRAREVDSREGVASFYSDLANRALHSTIVTTFPTAAGAKSPKHLVQAFLGNLVATCVDHVVSRDLSAHLGSKTLRNTVAVLELTRDLKAAARHVVASESVAPVIAATAAAPEQNWADLVSAAWAAGAGTQRFNKERNRG